MQWEYRRTIPMRQAPLRQAQLDQQLIDLFVAHGWRVNFYFPRNARTSDHFARHPDLKSQNNTAFGPVAFADGVLSVINENRMLRC